MNNVDYYPSPCEVEAFTRGAIAACDVLDGLEDDIISEPQLCDFTAHDVVGKHFSCNGRAYKFTRTGARLVQTAWDGPHSPDGSIGWLGLTKVHLSRTHISRHIVVAAPYQIARHRRQIC